MARLEDLTKGSQVRGILPERLVTIVDAKWHGSSVIELTYKDGEGQLGSELIYRYREPELEVVEAGSPWSFDGDGATFRLVSEARRIRLAYLFDPLLAVHTSLVDPLPHQITAVYGEMLRRQPLRYLLADDPGAGKTIMAGLFIKELLARGDLHRCLVVCPGMLVEQWQDELKSKFHLYFDILTNDKLEAAKTGNWFRETPLAICRLDKLSRDEDAQAKLEATEWDLVVVDEAHKMSATFFGREVKYTKRYRLGQLVSPLTRHLLLMTATPHNGKEEDFQLFLALLDGDRFEGRFRDGVHVVDTSDLMRRMVKEQLVKFDGKPLFPERRAETIDYKLSDGEAKLYQAVTTYVREEFNRADALQSEGRKGTVGFALTILQRRLASSPEAIYRSLQRRRERLERRLREERLAKRARWDDQDEANLPRLSNEEDWEDLADAPEGELEDAEEQIVDQATAARTIEELEVEISILQRLESLALTVRNSSQDRKWEELRDLLQNNLRLVQPDGHRRKLIVFTEQRDTLTYLAAKIRDLLGKEEAVVTIHGGMGREERRNAQTKFSQEKETLVLVATDAAGEGINLIRAHLMVNYDLPWNPNRLEQRFGRIHRIGQTEVCTMWNLVAGETREGDVYHLLLQKIEREQEALQGRVFDVLGRVKFEDRSLRELLVEAIRYGEDPEVRARLTRAVDQALDRDHLEKLLAEHALARSSMAPSKVQEIREQMDRAEARRLQPHFIESYFLEAFRRLGGTIHEREPRRYEITHVPGPVRSRDRQIGVGDAVLTRYERVTFEKSLISLHGKPFAEFVCPGHPLLDAATDLIWERNADLLKRGATLVDEDDPGEDIRVLCYLEHSIQDARVDSGRRRIVSKRLQFVDIDSAGKVRSVGDAPYLDLRPSKDEERALIESALKSQGWLKDNVEERALSYAVQDLAPEHLREVKSRKEAWVDKTVAAVKDRLTKEINFWDRRAVQLAEQERAGRANAKINSQKAQQRADELQTRLERRLKELEQERRLAPLAPIVVGGALVVPAGLLARQRGERQGEPAEHARETARVEQAAMDAVMAAERALGHEPRDVSDADLGYDVESRVPTKGQLRFIEVKGRAPGSRTVTVTTNEIRTGLNKPDDFILAVVEVDGDQTSAKYVRRAFQTAPDFAVTSVNYDLRKLLADAEPPN